MGTIKRRRTACCLRSSDSSDRSRAASPRSSCSPPATDCPTPPPCSAAARKGTVSEKKGRVTRKRKTASYLQRRPPEQLLLLVEFELQLSQDATTTNLVNLTARGACMRSNPTGDGLGSLPRCRHWQKLGISEPQRRDRRCQQQPGRG